MKFSYEKNKSNRLEQNKLWKINNPDRTKELNNKYAKSPKGKKIIFKNVKIYDKKFPERYEAKQLVKRDKEKNPNKYKNYCECCDKTKVRIEQHHEDYLKPLEVIALCNSCHTYIHKVETRCDILSILLFKGVWGKGGELKSLSN